MEQRFLNLKLVILEFPMRWWEWLAPSSPSHPGQSVHESKHQRRIQNTTKSSAASHCLLHAEENRVPVFQSASVCANNIRTHDGIRTYEGNLDHPFPAVLARRRLPASISLLLFSF